MDIKINVIIITYLPPVQKQYTKINNEGCEVCASSQFKRWSSAHIVNWADSTATPSSWKT